MPLYDHLAARYHEHLSDSIRRHLRSQRGLSDAVIDRYELGWDGQRIAIPIQGVSGHVVFFKLAKAPGDVTDGPKMKSSFGAKAELYGWNRVAELPERIIVCEGEFDRLALESRGFAAVTSTAGALTFRREWADALRCFREVFVCFDRDAAGEAGSRRIAWFLPEARIVTLPAEVGDSGDVTDFFVRLGRTADDFETLLAQARPLSDAEQSGPGTKAPGRTRAFAPTEASRLKAATKIEDWVSNYLILTVKGENYVARCPFHDDDTPSFVVFTATQTFHCFGCRAHGDIFSFLMRMRSINFAAACDVVRRAVYKTGDGEAAA